MRRRQILIGTLAIAVVVATIGGVAYALHTRTQHTRTQDTRTQHTRTQVRADGKSYPGLHAPVFIVCPGPTYSTTYQGARAIRPRNDCTPSFTQQDVRDYLYAAQGAFHGFGIQVTGQPTVTRVIFLTAGDLSRAPDTPNGAAGYPPDMLVCYAGLSGTFGYADQFGPPSGLSAVSIMFDAHTGNELGWFSFAPLG